VEWLQKKYFEDLEKLKSAQELEQKWCTDNAKEQAKKILEDRMKIMSMKLDQEMKHQRAELDDLRTLLTKKEEDIGTLKNTIIEQENIILHLRNKEDQSNMFENMHKGVSFDNNVDNLVDSSQDMIKTLAGTLNNPLKRSAFNYFFRGQTKKIDEETLKLLLDDNEKLKSKCDSLKALCDEY